MITSILFLSTLNIAQAENESRPLRPTTHPTDVALTAGPVENFVSELYCDPNTIASEIKPTTPGEGTGHLYIRNEYNGWVDVSIGENRIGRLQPFTTGVIHDVAAGEYTVSIAVERSQYTDTVKISTISEDYDLAPGNARSVVSKDPNYKKPGLDDNRVYPTGQLQEYTLPVAP